MLVVDLEKGVKNIFSLNLSLTGVNGIIFLLKAKKYNPATRKHETFVEKKLPPHSK